MNQIRKIIGLSILVFLAGLIFQGEIEAAGPLPQSPTLTPSGQQSTLPPPPVIPKAPQAPLSNPSTDTKKCVGDAKGGCCVSGDKVVVWGDFSAANCAK